MLPDAETCYRAVESKDARFDGWFFTAVTTTKIYCRPSCPARTPFRTNVEFLPTAAAAQRAGYRACKRCRPDASPGSPEWDPRGDVVARAMRLIADGVVDRDGVGGLARRLAYSERQLHRLLTAEVGAGPLALARAQRAQTARVLIETTDLRMADIAFAAGFASIRQFNDTVREVFATSPSALRHHHGPRPEPGTVTVRLAARQPFDGRALLEFLALRAVPGIEAVTDGAYRRSLALPHGPAVMALTPAADHVVAQFRLDDQRDLTAAVARARRLL
ncbi:MAG: DNA-3-methyladenine glycosylase 2 family protein, partial [Acidimicrobiia bacterium]|nr:DNA-3-methyladenine glycosylase 2 family protein [Acidimicrobiia bacterium]